MKVLIIGSTQYKQRMEAYAKRVRTQEIEVMLPAFDNYPGFNELDICKHNKSLVEWADEVHILWDQRSLFTVFDFGMAFALGKRVKVIYLEPQTLGGVMRKWKEESNGD